MEDFPENWVGRLFNNSRRRSPELFQRVIQQIHLGGLSNRFYRNLIVCFREQKTFCFENSIFLTFGLGMREGVSEGSRSGKG